MSARYAPGGDEDALLAVRGGVAVLVPAGGGRSAPVDADELWAALADAQPLTRVLELLTSGGLAATPDFAIVDARATTAHVIVRGAPVITADAGGSSDSLDGTDVATWRESRIPSFDVIRIGAAAQALLPIESGVARARSFEVAATPAPPAARPAPDTAPTVVAAQPVAEQTLTDPIEAGGALFEETVVRSVDEVALIGDHDGLTIVSGDIPGLADRERPEPAAAASSTATATATAYVLELDSGAIEPLIAPVILGRSPTASKVSSGAVPRLVSVLGNPDVSRNHVRVALEGDTVVVTDLHSRNGTSIALPGKPPQQLRAGEATSVLDGTVIDLGGSTVTVRSSR